MFNLFGSNSYLGIDLGDQIRVAEYKDNTFKTKEYSRLTEAIKLDFNTKNVITVIDSRQLQIKFLDIPEDLGEEEISQMLELEFEESGLVLQYEVIDYFNKRYVVALAVEKGLLEDQFQNFKSIGLRPKAIETEFHAKVRFLYHQQPELQETVSLINIAQNKTDLIIAKDAQPVFIRSFGFAGQHINERLAKINDMTIDQAKEYKKTNIESDDLKLVLEEIRTQIYSSLDYFQSEYRGSVAKLFLTGESSRIKGIKEYLENQIGITTWQLEEDFSVAKGLSLREDL